MYWPFQLIALDSSIMLRLGDIDTKPVIALLLENDLEFVEVDDGDAIPGSHWGDEEAGLIGSRLYARKDTPVHSLFHEACHYFLMDQSRRANLHTDAGGTSSEENAVCYLQICLAARFAEIGDQRMCRDMDSWGYSFRLGSARAWFKEDADDAIEFLKAGGFWQQFSLADRNLSI